MFFGGQTMKKIKELDVLSGMAIIMVILIHADRFYVRSILNLNSYLDAGVAVNILDNLIWASVPIFIFISGYKYYQNNICTNKNYFFFIKKQLIKILPLFLFVSLFYISIEFLNLAFTQNQPLESVLIHSSKRFLNIFLGYNIAYQLWYIPLYFFVIILYPLVYKKVSNDLNRFIVLTFVSIAVIYLGLLSYPIKFFYYLIFFDLGVQFNKHQLHKKINLLSISCIAIAIISICTINKDPHINIFLKHLILNPIMVIFYWKISFFLSNSFVLQLLGKYSFYIFLFHEPIIVKGISQIIDKTLSYNSFIYVFVVAITSIVITIYFAKIYLFFSNKISETFLVKNKVKRF